MARGLDPFFNWFGVSAGSPSSLRGHGHPPPDFHGSSGTGDPDTARRTRGDSSTFG